MYRIIKVDYANKAWQISLNSLRIGYDDSPNKKEAQHKILFSLEGELLKTRKEKEDAFAYMGALGALSYLDGRGVNLVFGEGVKNQDREAFTREHYMGIAEISKAIRKDPENHKIGRFAARKISGRIVKKYPALDEFRDTIKQVIRKGRR